MDSSGMPSANSRSSYTVPHPALRSKQRTTLASERRRSSNRGSDSVDDERSTSRSSSVARALGIDDSPLRLPSVGKRQQKQQERTKLPQLAPLPAKHQPTTESTAAVLPVSPSPTQWGSVYNRAVPPPQQRTTSDSMRMRFPSIGSRNLPPVVAARSSSRTSQPGYEPQSAEKNAHTSIDTQTTPREIGNASIEELLSKEGRTATPPVTAPPTKSSEESPISRAVQKRSSEPEVQPIPALTPVAEDDAEGSADGSESTVAAEMVHPPPGEQPPRDEQQLDEDDNDDAPPRSPKTAEPEDLVEEAATAEPVEVNVPLASGVEDFTPRAQSKSESIPEANPNAPLPELKGNTSSAAGESSQEFASDVADASPKMTPRDMGSNEAPLSPLSNTNEGPRSGAELSPEMLEVHNRSFGKEVLTPPNPDIPVIPINEQKKVLSGEKKQPNGKESPPNASGTDVPNAHLAPTAPVNNEIAHLAISSATPRDSGSFMPSGSQSPAAGSALSSMNTVQKQLMAQILNMPEANAKSLLEDIQTGGLKKKKSVRGLDAVGDDAEMRSVISSNSGSQQNTGSSGDYFKWGTALGKDSSGASTASGIRASRGGSMMAMSGGVSTMAVTPFVSNLAMRSFQLTSHDEPVVVPTDIHAASLFIDMTGYSRVAKALESQGAFALFDTVNAYLAKILDVVKSCKGEVMKFAGDAALVMWYGSEKKNTCRAMHCGLELQRSCGSHAVPNTDLSLTLHIGLVAGHITSSVFKASNVHNMEAHYHFIRGDCLRSIADVVETAKSGELCITEESSKLCCEGVEFEATSQPGVLKIVSAAPCSCVGRKNSKGNRSMRSSRRSSVSVNALLQSTNSGSAASPEEDVEDMLNEQDLEGFDESDIEDWEEDWERRAENMQKFVHPGVRRKLRQGLVQSQMAEMRLLTILFIHKTDEDVDVADWFAEVQQVLDDHRCPILQVIDDDKGVHLVAAINLHFADREPAITGIRLAKVLVERRSGCTIGIASGMTFCGVVGSGFASRWDITGAAVVRACRLMQYGVANGEPVVIGQSVLHYAQDDSLTLPMGETFVKGTPEPIKLFKLADVDTRILSAITSATRFSTAVHVPQFSLITRDIINRPVQRFAVIVHGPATSGKTYLCVRAVYQTGIVPLMHVAVENSKPMDTIRTLCEWFSNHKNNDVAEKARQGYDALSLGHTIRGSRIALELVDLTISLGMKTALIVRQSQCLDPMSLSFLRQSVARKDTTGSGRWLVFLTLVPQNSLPSFSAVRNSLGRHRVMALEVGQLDNLEASSLIEHRFGWRCDKELQRTIVETSGCVAGCIDAVIDYLQVQKELIRISCSGIVYAEQERLQEIAAVPWTTISPSVCAKSSQLVDALPTSSKTLLKVIAVLHTKFFPILRSFAVAVTSQLLTTTVTDKVNKDIDSLVELSLLREISTDMVFHGGAMLGDMETEKDASIAVAFRSPAILDVVKSQTLPVQTKQVSAIAARLFDNFDITSPNHHFARAHFYHFAGHQEDSLKSWREGLIMLKDGACDKKRVRIEKMIVEDLHRKGLTPASIGFTVAPETNYVSPVAHLPLLPEHVVRIKDFIPPLSLGFLTHALRQVALCLRTVCVDAGMGVTTPNSYLVEIRQFVNVYSKFVKQIDILVGFTSPVNDQELITSWLGNASYDEACGFASQYHEYMNEVVAKRVEVVHAYVAKVMQVPARPSEKPFWDGSEREALSVAMQNVLDRWGSCSTSAVRDGLMEMATQGWLPRNPDLTLEFQRDCYLRKRTQSVFCFISFLYVNLSLSWI